MTSSISVRRPSWLIVVLTLLFGFILTVCPLPGKIIWIRPAWIMMVLVYWLVMFPQRFGLGLAWIIGFFLDILNGSILGEHALAMTVGIYAILRIRTRFRFFPILQQSLAVFGAILLYQVVLFCVQGCLAHLTVDKWYWLVPFTSMLLWPWVFSMLHYFQSRFVTL